MHRRNMEVNFRLEVQEKGERVLIFPRTVEYASLPSLYRTVCLRTKTQIFEFSHVSLSSVVM